MSFFTTTLGSIGSVSSAQEFGDNLRRGETPLDVPAARFWEKIYFLTQPVVDPRNPPVYASRQQFTILVARIRKTVPRITLLESVHNPLVVNGIPLTFDKLIGQDPGRRALLEKICPGVFTATSLTRGDLIRSALEFQQNRLDSLLKQVIHWTFLQPEAQNLSQDAVFDMIDEVKGALTSKIKWISDPYIPFLTMAIEQRAIWHLRSIKNPDMSRCRQLLAALQKEQETILGKIHEMYYNTFLGSDHKKVQENIRNKNDLCKIEAQDIKDRILQLQLNAVAKHLNSNPKEQKDAYNLLLDFSKKPLTHQLDLFEFGKYQELIGKQWKSLSSTNRKMVSLQYFVTHKPKNIDVNQLIKSDLESYDATSKALSLAKESFPDVSATSRELEDNKGKIGRLTESLAQLRCQQQKLEEKLSRYPENLEEKAVNLQIEIWKLESEITNANRIMRFFLQWSLRRKEASLFKRIALLCKQSIDQARLNLCYEKETKINSEIGSERGHVRQTEAELARGREEFREIQNNTCRKHKKELDDLLSKVYYLTPEEFQDFMDPDDTQWVML